MEKSVASRNPLEWAAAHVETWSVPRPHDARSAALPAPSRISTADLWSALGQGYADFLAFRSDVIVLCLVYPIAGSLLWRLASGHSLPQLIFPLVAGFALVGPLCATGLYEMSRRHELGEPITWASAFAAFRSPGIRSILTLGICLLVVFVAWLAAAELIYLATLGPGLPASFAALTHDVLFTTRGRLMTIIGIDVGFFFAVAVLCTTAIAFPLLLDRKVTVSQAVQASIRAALTNPREMALWGLIVAGLLVLGSAPFLVGLIVVVPVLGHGTWHLYRKLIPTAGNLDSCGRVQGAKIRAGRPGLCPGPAGDKSPDPINKESLAETAKPEKSMTFTGFAQKPRRSRAALIGVWGLLAPAGPGQSPGL